MSRDHGAVSSFRECGLPCGLRGTLCTLHLCRSAVHLLHRCNTRYRWLVRPYLAGTCTLQETPSFAWCTNAGAHLLLEAGAQRTLEAVRCSAWFGADSGRGAVHGRAPSRMAPRVTDAASRTRDALRSAEDLVRLEQHHGRQREPEGLRRFEVDDELKPHRLLHGQVARPGPSQDFVYVGGALPSLTPLAGGIAHKTPCFHKRPPSTERGQLVLDREVGNPLAREEEERVRQHEERLGLPARHRGEGTVEGGGLADL